MLALLIVAGIYFTCRTRFFMPRAVLKTIRDTLCSLKSNGKNGISPLAAVSTALGGTVGVGSIVGVGYGIAVGGAGSVFWMWVCSFFGMGLKYAEVRIALNDRTYYKGCALGGAPYRLKKLGCNKLAVVFCLLCIAASFGTGNLTQVGSLSAFFGAAGVPKTWCSVICVFIIAAAVFGGRGRIASLNKFIVPAASAVYLTACIAIIILNAKSVPTAFGGIFKGAFGVSAVTGGFSGAALAFVIREGFARSLFSNEAGMGSSPLAHATSAESNPAVQAEWGIFEIFFDTFVVSTLTALCLLSSGESEPLKMFGMMFGGFGRWGFLLLTAVFAFASVISWCYYAECCISFMFPESRLASKIYRILFSLAAMLGVYLSGTAVWELSDILNALMTFPNMFLLFKCRKEIGRL